ncbi:hypothetical protein C0995_009591 [Termitomyces sp. Mi166|nr:hypothetical protein C0995_009591 [Termitomyces sp. Mi166\
MVGLVKEIITAAVDPIHLAEGVYMTAVCTIVADLKAASLVGIIMDNCSLVMIVTVLQGINHLHIHLLIGITKEPHEAIFLILHEGEAWCHQEAQECANAIWQEFCDTVAAALPLPAPLQLPIAEVAAVQIKDVATNQASMHSEAQLLTAVQILDTIAVERAELAQECKMAAQERERLAQELMSANQTQVEAQDAYIKELQDELAAVQAELKNKKQ